MAHVTSGIRKILELPSVYNFFQSIIGGDRSRIVHFNKHFNLEDGSRILDFGCGTAVLLNWLTSNVEYFGVDIEKKYIEWNRKRYGGRGQFFHENVIEVERKEWFSNFDAINAHGLLHHLSDDECLILIDRAYKYLKPSGYLVTVDSVYHENQTRFSRWLVSRDRGQNIRTPSKYLKLAHERFEIVDGELLDSHLKIPFGVFVMVMKRT